VSAEVAGIAELDLTAYVRPGDLIVWSQACAEPLTLVEALAAQRTQLDGVRCFTGISSSPAVCPEHADYLSFISYSAAGANRSLSRAGLLEILPCHYSELPRILGDGPLRADVVFLSLPPARADGSFGLGLGSDYVSTLVGRARVVIAEINDQVPDLPCDRRLRPDEIDVLVHTSRPPAQYPAPAPGPVDAAIAAHLAALIPDGATLQLGIGTIPSAVARRLAGHRDLGVHSGTITDAIAELIQAGVITGARKSTDRGLVITGMLMGTSALIECAAADPRVQLRDTRYTHDPAPTAWSRSTRRPRSISPARLIPRRLRAVMWAPSEDPPISCARPPDLPAASRSSRCRRLRARPAGLSPGSAARPPRPGRTPGSS
jgi:acyl-CoA hydrolase